MNIKSINKTRLTLLIASLIIFSASIQSCDFFPPDWPEGSERTHFPKSQLNFMVVGDWGRKGRDYQRHVAERMGLVAKADSSRFILSTGDNFYENGVESLEDTHWIRSFEDVYVADALQVPWYITLGNHDYKGNVDAQVSYTTESTRWHLPSHYYKKEFMLEDSTQVLFVFLDTIPLSKQLVDFDNMQKEDKDSAEQLTWLNTTLEQSPADWKIVVGHHPLFSAGEKHRNNNIMIGNIHHILEQHNVQAYFSGHAHSLQHLKPKGSVEYFISGAGSKIRKVRPNEITRAAASVPGFIAVSITNETLTAQMVDSKGKLHHEAVINR